MWRIKKQYRDGALIYTKKFEDGFVVDILIAKMTNGNWNVDPSTNLFPERNFKTKYLALKYARQQMRKNK